MSISLEYITTSAIKQRKNDWAVPSERAIELACVALEGGLPEAVLVNSKNEAVCNWLAVIASKRLGHTTIPIVRAEHLSDEQLAFYAIQAKRMADLCGLDEAILAIELRELQAHLQLNELPDIGFESAEIDRILKLTEAELVPEAEFEEPAPGPSIFSLGELWLIGDHRLLCSDALLSSSYIALMKGELAHFILSDVPYNLSASTISGNGRFKHSDFVMAAGELSPAEFTRFLTTWMRHMKEHSVNGSLHAFFMS